MIYEGN
jgi:hypothetical protein